MLTELRLDDWKSFGSGEGARNVVKLAPLTLIVGANASGKSNLLDALRFLHGSALDLPLADVLSGHHEAEPVHWPGIRGGIVEASKVGTSSFTLSSDWTIGGVTLSHRMKVWTAGRVAIGAEALHDETSFLFSADDPGTPSATSSEITALVRASGAGSVVLPRFVRSRALLGQVAPSTGVHPLVFGRAQALRHTLRGVVFPELTPSRIAGALAGLEESVRKEIIETLALLTGLGTDGFVFETSPRGEVSLHLLDRGGTKISLASTSEGTLRFLALMTTLLTAPRDAIVVIEEPALHVHSSRMHLLAHLLERVTRDRGVQIIATTQSAPLLCHLTRERLEDTVVLAREPVSGASIATRLGQLPNVEALHTAEDRERMISRGWLERALLPLAP